MKKMDVLDAFKQVKNTISNNVTIVAVSKTKPEEDILALYNADHKIFGENKVQELQRKQENLPKDIEWHFIGHLQTNKVKYIAPYISVIQSVDSIKILKEINKRAEANNRTIKCLLQFHIAKEESKFGFKEEDIEREIKSLDFNNLKNIDIIGVMGMATYTTEQSIVKEEFKGLKNIFSTLKKDVFKDKVNFTEISMGMSNDYLIAIEEGATMVRIGSTIFGSR